MSLPHGIALFAVLLFSIGTGLALHGISRAGEVEREARLTAARGELDRERLAAMDGRRAEAHVASTRERLVELATRRNAARRVRNMGFSLCLAAFAFGAFALFLVRDGESFDDEDDLDPRVVPDGAASDEAEDAEAVDPSEVIEEPADPGAVS